jgi:Uma2 family endonuclease
MRAANTGLRALSLVPASDRDVPLIRLPVRAGTFDGIEIPGGHLTRRGGKRSTKRFQAIDHLKICIAGFTIEVPGSAATLDGFRAWATSDQFPDHGRISFINQEILIDMSPEELETHNKVKTAVVNTLFNLNGALDLGELYSDRALLVSSAAGLATEPDGQLVKWQTLRTRRVRLVPCKGKPGQFMELHGSPDWVLEIVSQSSVDKDARDLRTVYHRARVPEYWLIDARGASISFQILARCRGDYEAVPPQGGWYFSPVFGRHFRLERRRSRAGRWQYKLRVRAA